MISSDRIQVFENSEQVSIHAAQLLTQKITESLKTRDHFTVLLSGGRTPKQVYALLASRFRKQIPWSKVFFFFGDERCVPPDSPESNFHMVKEAFFDPAEIPATQYFRVLTEKYDPRGAAENYDKKIRSFFSSPAKSSKEIQPHFDFVFLGMGPDGHTASLFPDSNYEELSRVEPAPLVIAPFVEKLNASRISVTLKVINQAKNIVFLVTGKDKTETFRMVKEQDGDFPIEKVRPVSGKTHWLVDRDAAQG